ncbi:short-chain dehydrogenase [Colletotrichum higginsianum]|nr:short-chain dehydrogenase [Colletotrichum higginsianum]
MTIVVLVIGMKKIYWYPEAGPLIHGDYRLDAETISNVLQLVAKIHELLIVASLSSIALAMFRHRLITNGVRLGFLTGSYRVGDVGYLGTAAFWRQGLDIQGPWEILLSGFLVFATIMSTVVGPASAVLLLPTLDCLKT